MSKKQFAIVFPGQGSQAVGMLQTLAAAYPSIKETFSEASQLLGYDLWQLTQEGPAEKLNQTEFTQPALLTAEYSLWQCWQTENGAMPAYLAGHSLGEYSALLCSGVLTFSDALLLVAERGRLMQQAVKPGEGAMAAIIGLDDDAIIALCENAKQDQEVLSPANFNSIGQTVIAGHTRAIENAIQLAKAKGAKLAKRLPVSVPSHCALMQSAADHLAEKIETISFSSPQIPVIQNVDVKIHQDSHAIKKALIAQLTNPVQWVRSMQYFEEKQIHLVIECGPGKVLTGLNKRISKQLSTYPISDQDGLMELIQKVNEEILCL